MATQLESADVPAPRMNEAGPCVGLCVVALTVGACVTGFLVVDTDGLFVVGFLVVGTLVAGFFVGVFLVDCAIAVSARLRFAADAAASTASS